MTTILSSREFNQDTSGAKKAANEAPVFITDRGRPTHVLPSIDAYEQLTDNAANIVEWLRMPDGIDFEPQRIPLNTGDVQHCRVPLRAPWASGLYEDRPGYSSI